MIKQFIFNMWLNEIRVPLTLSLSHSRLFFFIFYFNGIHLFVFDLDWLSLNMTHTHTHAHQITPIKRKLISSWIIPLKLINLMTCNFFSLFVSFVLFLLLLLWSQLQPLIHFIWIHYNHSTHLVGQFFLLFCFFIPFRLHTNKRQIITVMHI